MDTTQRDKEIRESDEHWSALADRYGLSRSSIYRIRRDGGGETFADAGRPAGINNRKLLFQQAASSGLTRYGGSVEEEFQRELQGDGGAKLYTEMGAYPVISAVLLAFRMSTRFVNWFMESASDQPKDREAADFVEECRDDMSQSWDEIVSQVFTMLQFGYSVAETVYKRRLGQKPPKYVEDPARSRFSDGRIGWRRWQFMAPNSLTPGNQWDFDERGRVQGIRQTAPPDYREKYIPMEKALLFRTTVDWDNPEGLALDPWTQVPTPDGWLILDELGVGDRVFDEEGKIRYVVARKDWKDRPCYRITFNNDDEIIADANHLWYTETVSERSKGRPGKIRTTKDIAATVKNKAGVSNHAIPWAKPLDYISQHLHIPPYVLGLWLGDGTAKCGEISCHAQDLDETEKLIRAFGYNTVRSHSGSVGGNGRKIRVHGLQTQLRALGVFDNKHIPKHYLLGDEYQREMLLSGLMDSDGTIDAYGRCEFYNTNKKLVDGVAELVRSLGVSAVMRERKVPDGQKQTWVVKFTPPWSPFKLERKKERTINERARTYHYIIAVEEVEPRRTVCLEVDSPSHQFLVGDGMIPTHNSLLRAMYTPWYYATNLSEVEAIGAERLGTGLPVVYLGSDTSSTGSDSDYELAIDLVRNVRSDEQMGVVIPKAKMGGGAPEGQGILFELLSPPSRGFVDFNEIITRYEQRMAMSALTQFIFLGMARVGTQALAGEQIDFYQTAVGAWADAVAGIVNRFAIPRLIALNAFDLEKPPQLRHTEFSVPDLKGISDYITTLVGAQVLLPYPELEQHLIQLAGLPEKPAELRKPEPEREQETEESSETFGGPGSGHHGHKGIPGQRGGSVPGGGRMQFGSTAEGNAFLNDNKSLNPTLSDAENSAMEYYKGDGYFQINSDLRTAGYSMDPHTDSVESAISKARLEQAITAYRGASIEDFEDEFDFDMTGSIFEDQAFVSTSLSRSVAFMHSDGVMIEIRVPAGSPAINAERWSAGIPGGEAELLIQRNAKFRVISDDYGTDDDNRNLVVEYIQ